LFYNKKHKNHSTRQTQKYLPEGHDHKNFLGFLNKEEKNEAAQKSQNKRVARITDH